MMSWKERLSIPLAGLMLAPMATRAAVLEEVVVTAQKREQSLQDVGIAVTALDGEQMRQLGFANAQQVTAMAPGVSTVQTNGEANYTIAIRGASNSDFTTNQESPVSLYIDEVYVSQSSGSGFMLFDMERVEILRGPQGTLFGRNATGGLAHFVTKKPTQDFEGYGQFTVGRFEQFRFEGAVSGGLTDSLSGRLSVATHHNEGYVDNRLLDEDLNNANDYAVRGQVLFEPTADISLLVNARASLSQIRTGFFENVSSSNGVLTPNVPNFNGYIDTDGDVYAGDYDRFGFNDLETYGFTGTLKWNLGFAELTSITDYQSVERDYQEDSDASPLPDFNFYLTTDSQQYSQELRLNGDAEDFRWVGGFYYLDINTEDSNGAEIPLSFAGLPNSITPSGNFTGIDNPYVQDKRSWSLFGQVEYDLNQQLTAIAGIRYINEKVDFRYNSNQVVFRNDGSTKRGGNPNLVSTGVISDLLGAPVAGGNLLPFFGFPETITDTYDEGLWSAKVELDWRPSDDALYYVSWNRGVKGGGFNAPLQFFVVTPLEFDSFSFEEEKLDAFEVGAKLTALDGRARINAAVYYNDYENYQAFRIEGLSTTLVDSDAESYGGELEIQLSLDEHWDFMLGVAYNDTDLEIPLAAGGTLESTPVQTPRWNLNGLLRYQRPLFAGTAALQADFQYRSEVYFALTKSPAVTEDGYTLTNLRASWTSPTGQWEGAVFVQNLTNEEYLVTTFDLSADLGMTEQYYGRPRWWGASIAYRF